MKNSKETRTCVSCRNKDNKYNLIRIIYSKEERVQIDLNQNLEGRGAYICKKEECLDKLIKQRKLEKALKIKISNEEYEKLRGVMLDK